MSDDAEQGTPARPRITGSTAYPREQTPPPSERLEEDNRHPVMIFGSSRSGKSTMIMSFINALEKSGRDGSVGVSATFGRSFYERRDERVKMQMDAALAFFNTASHTFILGRQALKTTQVDQPYFIPIDLKIKGSEADAVKIALLDGRGEWYEPNSDPNAPIYRELQDDIVEIMKNYLRGISVICLAPFSLGDNDQHDTANSDAGLFSAITKYGEARSEQNRYEDSILFLLSKWDQVAPPQRDDRFSRIDGQSIVNILTDRYPRSWDSFRVLPLGAEDWARRCFMQYSSCSFVDGKPRFQDHLADAYFRYPRTVLNWIYGNARKFELKDGDRVDHAQLVLFSDVVPKDIQLEPISERILRAIVRK